MSELPFCDSSHGALLQIANKAPPTPTASPSGHDNDRIAVNPVLPRLPPMHETPFQSAHYRYVVVLSAGTRHFVPVVSSAVIARTELHG